MPETLKGAPLRVISEIVKSAVPAFDRVTVEEVLLPIVALPASSTAGLTRSWGCAGAAVAVALTTAAPSVSGAWKVMVAAVLPGAAPLNQARKFTVWPGARVKGKVNPEIVN